MFLKKGIKLLEERVGEGPPVERQRCYLVAMRLSLSKGEVLPPGRCASYALDENLEFRKDGYFVHRTLVNREALIAGLFYTLESMRVGEFRKVRISPHLAYKEKGVPDLIPPNAVLVAEIEVLRQKPQKPQWTLLRFLRQFVPKRAENSSRI